VVSFGDLDVRMSDNYFDLLPGEPVSIRLSASSSLDELKSALKTMSLTEAFDGMETPSPSPVVQTSGN
jgi:beta-mannosidase